MRKYITYITCLCAALLVMSGLGCRSSDLESSSIKAPSNHEFAQWLNEFPPCKVDIAIPNAIEAEATDTVKHLLVKISEPTTDDPVTRENIQITINGESADIITRIYNTSQGETLVKTFLPLTPSSFPAGDNTVTVSVLCDLHRPAVTASKSFVVVKSARNNTYRGWKEKESLISRLRSDPLAIRQKSPRSITSGATGSRQNAGANNCGVPVVYRMAFAYAGTPANPDVASYQANQMFAMGQIASLDALFKTAMNRLSDDYLLPETYSSIIHNGIVPGLLIATELLPLAVSQLPMLGLELLVESNGIYALNFDLTYLAQIDDFMSQVNSYHDDALRVWPFFRLVDENLDEAHGSADLSHGTLAFNTEIFTIPSGWETIVHEFGHVMGLDHETQLDNLMFPESLIRGSNLAEIQLRTLIGHLCSPDPISFFHINGLPFVNPDSIPGNPCGNGMMDSLEQCELNFNSRAPNHEFGGLCVVQADGLPVLSDTLFCKPTCMCEPQVGGGACGTGPCPVGGKKPPGGTTVPPTGGRPTVKYPTTLAGTDIECSDSEAQQCTGVCGPGEECIGFYWDTGEVAFCICADRQEQ